MELSFKIQVNATKENIWNLYCDVKKWLEWDNHLEEVYLQGDFSNGIAGKMKMAGLPPLDFILSKVIDEKEFWNYSQTPLGTINFGHKISSENGKTFIEHIVLLETEIINQESLKMLENIFSDVPSSMLKLKELVEK